MNMPLTTGQKSHLDTVRELSNADRRAMDAIAADIKSMRAPAIDAAACDAAGVNEVATADEGRTYPMDEWLDCRAFVRSFLGREPSNAETEMYRQGKLARFAGNRSDAYGSVAGNSISTVGHDAPLVKGGQGRNGIDVSDAAAVMFTVLAAIVVLGMIAYFAFGGAA